MTVFQSLLFRLILWALRVTGLYEVLKYIVVATMENHAEGQMKEQDMSGSNQSRHQCCGHNPLNEAQRKMMAMALFETHGDSWRTIDGKMGTFHNGIPISEQ